MNKNIKIIITVLAIFIIVGIIIGGFYSLNKNKSKNNSTKMNIVVTSFSSYDFVKHIVGDLANITYLLGPGVDAHSYEPSPSDLVKIQNSDIFIYIGGEMESWLDTILASNSINTNKTKLIKVSEAVNTIEEQEVDGAENSHEHDDEDDHNHENHSFDEHIWSSPKNAIKMMNYLNNKITELDPNNKEIYKENTESYIAQITELQEQIQDIINNKKRNLLVFGDKMPMQYFLNEFDLIASAAFSGCSTETEPSTKTITYLVNKVKQEHIPVVLYIELSTGKTAQIIAQETGSKAMQIQTLHNISKTDFDNGESYVSLMYRNLDVLKQALQ
ncbi:MAG: zinc ABC transporter substrate-binding protein [Clostridia bacterium]|nr:zinc ABC transporter substrate-binding protein [Clostridia bacterium]